MTSDVDAPTPVPSRPAAPAVPPPGRASAPGPWSGPGPSGGPLDGTSRPGAGQVPDYDAIIPPIERTTGWRLLLVEDDDGDALLVRELLADGLPGAVIERVATLADAVARAGDVECVLLDIGLPDAHGTRGVEEITAAAPHTAVVVLTGADSERLGVGAVMAGAQDYLIKGRVDDQLLARSVRYAIERQRAALLSRELFDAERRRAENTRVERALAPTPVIRSDDVTVAIRYLARREGSELGGDFLDAVEDADGALHVLIGDVAGHGPDEAALAVRLRGAWRALTLAGLSQLDVVDTLDRFIRTEWDTITFATVCSLVVAADRTTASLVLAGHPPPIAVADRSRVVGDDQYGSLLGVLPEPKWTPVQVALDPNASLLLYTDGLIEGWAAPEARTRLGVPALLPIIDDFHRLGTTPDGLLDGLLAEAQRRNGGPLTDDVALCLVQIGRRGA
ncbi:MAG TPA: SpoIIE family protein phosphatase [Acidimicrobiales bacterium]|nr:SpoIIE family protein phosphatase [Acidimicrobiales bacterium]